MIEQSKVFHSSGTISSIGKRIPCGEFKQIHSIFDRNINFLYNDLIVSLSNIKSYEGVLRLVIPNLELHKIKAIEHYPGKIIINGNEIFNYIEENIYDPFLPQMYLRSNSISSDLTDLKAKYLAKDKQYTLAYLLNKDNVPIPERSSYDSEFMKQMNRAFRALKDGNYPLAVQGFKGRGYGLTPSGDDFLIGYLIGLSFREYLGDRAVTDLKQEIYRLALGSNPLVNTFLFEAVNGYCNSYWKSFLTKLIRGTGDVVVDFEAILSEGETSGYDMMAGFLTCFEIEI
ncbi:MAG: DUF2877 domain-containing protein [Candidatus Cloacimonetes bacterium]|nr:DUF2877 domain-containing protein [Candidatus Cloacimonadota bacterium]